MLRRPCPSYLRFWDIEECSESELDGWQRLIVGYSRTRRVIKR
jgi:hypothetical protein